MPSSESPFPVPPTTTVCPRCGNATAHPFAGASGVCLRCAGERAFALGSEAPFESLALPDATAAPVSADSASAHCAVDLPASIGPYEIIEELGRGGMGRVYAARQRGLGRIVALKVLTLGRGAPVEWEMRFLREAQTVARLRHPHIVAIHDSGRAAGQVYFSMDYLEGGDLAHRLRERPFTPRESAALVAKIASALAFAHAEGVLHRDLKPSNILLDGDEPRLADFGLAAQLETSGDLTSASGVFGTPHYLAPEAVRGGGAALTAASDQYALGIVLYVLLTGRTPFAGASPAELPALNNETDPPAPRLLAPAVPRDLETICLKCLEREPARRYATAAALADDLRHFVAGESIAARPPGRLERFLRFARRHRVALLSTTGAFLVLAVATAVSISLAVRATRAERHATEEAATAQAVLAFLKDDLLAKASPELEPDPEIKLRTVVDRAATTVTQRFNDRPPVELAIQETLGVTYGGIGDSRLKHEHLARAATLAAQLFPPDHPRRLEIETHCADALHSLGRYTEAETLKVSLLTRLRRVHGEEHELTLRALADLATIRYALGRTAEAEQIGTRVINLQTRVLGPDHTDTLASTNNLGLVLERLGRDAEAADLYASALTRARRVLGLEHGLTTTLMNNLGHAHLTQGRLDAAEALLHEALAVRRRTLGPEHPVTLTIMNSLGVIYRSQRKLAEAETLLTTVAALRHRILTADHPATIATDNALAATYREAGKFAEAIALFRSALERRTRLLPPSHPDTLRTMHALAQTYLAQGNLAEAITLFTRTAALRSETLGPTNPETIASTAALRSARERLSALAPSSGKISTP